MILKREVELRVLGWATCYREAGRYWNNGSVWVDRRDADAAARFLTERRGVLHVVTPALDWSALMPAFPKVLASPSLRWCPPRQ
jgi:hypothetical protein